MTVKKRFEISVILGLLFTILLSLVGFEASCCEIRDKIFRVHIIANSDSAPDQELKLKIRDQLQKTGNGFLENAENKQDAINITKANLNFIKEEAERIIAEEGFDYSVEARVEKAYFPTRVYDSFTLPAGRYDSVRLILGEGEGKNWWCILYPSVCLSACSDFEEKISSDTLKIIENPDDFKLKFKLFELLEGTKEKLIKIF